MAEAVPATRAEGPLPAGRAPPPAATSLSVCYALADQDFARTKSIGIFNASVGLLAALARRPDIDRLHILSNRTLTPFLPSGPRVTRSEHNLPLGGKLGRIGWDQWMLARAARASGCPWLFLPKGFPPWIAPLPARTACYVHDVIQEFFRDHYPQAFSWQDRRYFTWSLGAALRRAALIFTSSEFGRQEVLRYAASVRRTAPPVVVAGIGFDPVGPPRSDRTDSIVCLASRWPHKRTDLALDYLARWQREIAYSGTVHWVGEAPDRLAWPAFSNWQKHPRLDHAAYDRMVAEARALVQFSEYEGFGMPPVEAVLRGACPVYSRLPATTEVMAGVGQPFDNHDFESFRLALNRALTTGSDTLAKGAQALARRFSWEAVGTRIVEGLLRVDES